jgi:hypothetical protein
MATDSNLHLITRTTFVASSHHLDRRQPLALRAGRCTVCTVLGGKSADVLRSRR